MSQRALINAKTFYCALLAFAFLAVIFIGDAHGETTEFTYQGRLTDAGNPATGMYDFQFKLFDSTDFVTGIQQGPTLTRFAVEVMNGVFTVQLANQTAATDQIQLEARRNEGCGVCSGRSGSSRAAACYVQ